MSNLCRRNLIAKPLGYNIYKWCPQPTNYTKAHVGVNYNKPKSNTPYYCNATAGSQGFDFITTYVYNVVMYNGSSNNLAYVACDYVA
jgi:hypothetical protein